MLCTKDHYSYQQWYRQGAPRSQEGGYNTSTFLNSTASPTPSFNRGKEERSSQECNFDRGFVFMASSDGRTLPRDNSDIIMLVLRRS